jgi:hypothetical protein
VRLLAEGLGAAMTLARVIRTGPIHVVIAGRTICGGSPASYPCEGEPTCRQCERTLERNRRIRAEHP